MKSLSHVWLFAIPWTVVYQASRSMGFFSRQEYWSGLPFPSPGDLPEPGIELRSPALQAALYPLSHQGSPNLLLPSCKDCLNKLLWTELFTNIIYKLGGVVRECLMGGFLCAVSHKYSVSYQLLLEVSRTASSSQDWGHCVKRAWVSFSKHSLYDKTA